MLNTIKSKLIVWDTTLNQFIFSDDSSKQTFPAELLSETSTAIVAMAEYLNIKSVELFVDSFSKQTKSHQINSAFQALLLFWIYKYEQHAMLFATEVSGRNQVSLKNEVLYRAKKKLLPLPTQEYRSVIGITCAEGKVSAKELIAYFLKREIRQQSQPELKNTVEIQVQNVVLEEPVILYNEKEAKMMIRASIRYIKILYFSHEEIMQVVLDVVCKKYDVSQNDLQFFIKEGKTKTHANYDVMIPRGVFFTIVKKLKKKISLQELVNYLTPDGQKEVMHSNAVNAMNQHNDNMRLYKTDRIKFFLTLSMLSQVLEVISHERERLITLDTKKRKELFQTIVTQQFM